MKCLFDEVKTRKDLISQLEEMVILCFVTKYCQTRDEIILWCLRILFDKFSGLSLVSTASPLTIGSTSVQPHDESE